MWCCGVIHPSEAGDIMVKFNKFTSRTAGEDHKLLLKCLLPKILNTSGKIDHWIDYTPRGRSGSGFIEKKQAYSYSSF